MRIFPGLMCFLWFPVCIAQIKISEVMFNPAGTESSDEYIELYNASATDSFKLSTIFIGDQKIQESVDLNGKSPFLAPQCYAVIFDSDYDVSEGAYASLIPESAKVLKVADKTLGSAGLSNSTPESIIVKSEQGDTLDAYTYSLDNNPGFSDERIDLLIDNSPGNWANSQVLNGSPGFENSVSTQTTELEIKVTCSAIEGVQPRIHSECVFVIDILNTAEILYENLILKIIVDDSIVLASHQIPMLEPGEFYQIKAPWKPITAGKLDIDISITSDLVEKFKLFEFWVEWPKQSLVINEVMFAPLSGEPEWIEVYNRSDMEIPIAEWKIKDASGRQGLVEVVDSLVLKPDEFALFTADSSVRTIYSFTTDMQVVHIRAFPTLNNTNETIALTGKSGAIIDSISIHLAAEKGISIERIDALGSSVDQTNWTYSLSEAGATPCKINSVSAVEIDLAIDTTSVLWPDPPPERNKYFHIVVPILNVGKQQAILNNWRLTDRADDYVYAAGTSSMMIDVGDTLLIQIEHVANKSGTHNFAFEIDVTNDNRRRNNRWIFDISVSFLSRDIVLNEIMANPLSGEPEWVEIINLSSQPIDLNNWSISDGTRRGKLMFNGGKLILMPKDYFLITQELSRSDDQLGMVVPEQWPSLNNSGDSVFIFDQNDCIIDSISYTDANVGENGVSWENMNFMIADIGPAGWDFCVSPKGSTPGRQNSLFVEKLESKSKLKANPDPFSPDGDGIDDHVLIQYDLPMQTSNVNLVIFDLRGRKVRHLLRNASSGPNRALFWDGRNDEGQLMDVGIYIIFVQALDAAHGELLKLKKTIVLAKKL
ncbi:MAG: hypothetical protein DWQ10_12955 [Calditrichaeota bacterium]|nr:MAG: hypothetical protein DWQ10_12955 [Calditrichota bacterium]